MTTQSAMLPVDNTGTAATNLISNELHQNVSTSVTFINPNAGSYFKDSMQVYSVDGLGNLTPLVNGVDYKHGDLDTEATAGTAKKVYRRILFLRPIVTSLISISYQAYGGLNNINYAALYTAFASAALGTNTPLSSIANVPLTFNPQDHVHDIRDVYGMEYFAGFLSNIQAALIASASDGKYKAITDNISAFAASLANYNMALYSGIRQHIDGTGYAHNLTAAQVGLGNIQNYSFSPMVVNGVTIPYYIDPAGLLTILNPLPSYKPTTHATLTNNPHDDSVSNIAGLNNIVNLPSVTTYVTGAGTYKTLLSPTATQVYLCPYPAIQSVIEATTDAYAAQYTQATTNYFNQINANLASANTAINTANATNTNANAVNSSVASGITTINNDLTVIAEKCNKNALVNYNSPVAAVLEKLLTIEYTNFSSKGGITRDGFFPIPENIPNLVSWVYADNPDNTLFSDSVGNVRLIKLVDKVGSRVFTSNPSSAPIFGPSTDKTLSAPGIINGNVMKFNNGYNLTLSSGTPITLVPGMTIISVIKTAAPGTELALLTNPKAPSKVGIYGNTSDNRSISIVSGSGWIPMSAPPGGQPANKSTILVASISGTQVSNCWLASSNAFDSTTYPTGLSTPITTWPSSNYVGDPLTQIGNANYAIANAGEIAEIIIYSRQLSGAEVNAITAYLQLKYTLNTALAVDFAALSAF